MKGIPQHEEHGQNQRCRRTVRDAEKKHSGNQQIYHCFQQQNDRNHTFITVFRKNMCESAVLRTGRSYHLAAAYCARSRKCDKDKRKQSGMFKNLCKAGTFSK